MNPDNFPVPCTCEQWKLNTQTGDWEINSNPYDPGSEPLCMTITAEVMPDITEKNYYTPYPRADPHELVPPELFVPEWPCEEQHVAIQQFIANGGLSVGRPLVDVSPGANGLNTPDPHIGSGFYRDRVSETEWNLPVEPLGCRIIGRPVSQSHEELSGFGASIAQSGNELIISAPFRDAVDSWDVSGMLTDENEDSGVAYIFTNIDLWDLSEGVPGADIPGARIPPKPHMYEAGGGGFTHSPDDLLRRRDITFVRTSIVNIDGGLHVAGRSEDRIRNIIGIPDFNGDARADYMVGTPLANDGDGVAYVTFRRANSLEGDYVLDKLALDPHDVGRLSGVYVTGNPGETAQFGSCLAGGVTTPEEEESGEPKSIFDFNGDGVDDVAIGSPNGNGGTGEVLIIFATNQLTSPAEGIDVDTLLAQGKAALITGIEAGSGFGFNIANAGDIDGDDTDDLLIAAPFATPKFDSTPNDNVDQLNTPGLDRDLDGQLDDVTGPGGVPDGVANEWDELNGAGLVYVVFSSADTRAWSSANPVAAGQMIISIDRLGAAELPGFIIAGRRGADVDPPDPARPHLGDRLGGGDAGHEVEGNAYKSLGRSQGLAAAGDVDGDGKADVLIGSILADPRVDPQTGVGTVNGGEAYLIYGFSQND